MNAVPVSGVSVTRTCDETEIPSLETMLSCAIFNIFMSRPVVTYDKFAVVQFIIRGSYL